MSKVTEFVEREWLSEPRFSANQCIIAKIGIPDGFLIIGDNRLSHKDAVNFAQWILDQYGDSK